MASATKSPRLWLIIDVDAADAFNVATVPLFQAGQRFAGWEYRVLRAHPACIPQPDVSKRATFLSAVSVENRPPGALGGKLFDDPDRGASKISRLCVACRLLSLLP